MSQLRAEHSTEFTDPSVADTIEGKITELNSISNGVSLHPYLTVHFQFPKDYSKKSKKKKTNQKTQAVYSVKAYNNKICTQL